MSKLEKIWNKMHKEMVRKKYAYNFTWMGVPILQVPQDLQALHEIIWRIKPELIIETGVALGGSLLFSASMLRLLGELDKIVYGIVVGVEINLLPEAIKNLKESNLWKMIHLIEGSSIEKYTFKEVKSFAEIANRVIVCLDSNHTHEHVLKELRLYSTLVSVGSYIIVNDTGIENLPKNYYKNRSWGKGNNPMTAVDEFLKENDNFEIDYEIQNKLIITGHPKGYLRRIK